MMQALETEHLGKRYGRTWALHDCNLEIPAGHVTGLVGPNGAGKTTLLHLAMGLLMPTSGSVKMLGSHPGRDAERLLPKVGFVAQDRPLYKSFRVEEMLALGRKLNRTWDQELALKRLQRLNIPLHQRVGKLSGGQQAQVALVMTLAKRPQLLLLDEPVANLDPLARREFQQTLMDAVAEEGLSVILSSHIVADFERFCDHLVILSASRVQVVAQIDDLLQSHKLLIGPRERVQTSEDAGAFTILSTTEAERQCTMVVHMHGPLDDPAWEVRAISLEEIILAYLAQPLKGSAKPVEKKERVRL